MSLVYRETDLKMKTRSSLGKKTIEGYFIVFNQKTELWSGYFEEIKPEALNGQLNKDIRALADHDSAKVLGRAKNGSLKMRVDDVGLYATIEINENDKEAVNVYERVKRGDIDQCSFSFTIEDSSLSTLPGGGLLETVKKINLIEISVVTFPAYENTSVKAREEEFKNKNNKHMVTKKESIAEFKSRLLSKLKGREKVV